MTTSSLTVVIWNAEWRTRSRLRNRVCDRLWSFDPDIVCLTETHDNFPGFGHLVCSDPDFGYPLLPSRRKVTLWSRNPWQQIDALGSLELPSGRYLGGITETPLGLVDIRGVCVPWAQAHVSSGRRDRTPWQDHVEYLRALTPLIENLGERGFVAGDFNQHIPRKRAPIRVYNALRDCMLERLITPTAGRLGTSGTTLIDHLAHTCSLRAVCVETISNIDEDGARLSDHLGVRVVLTAS